MKNKSLVDSRLMAALAVCVVTASPSARSVAYQPSELGQSNRTQIVPSDPLSLDPISPPSFLESYQKSEADKRKSAYFEVLNLLKDNKLKEAEVKIDTLIKGNPKAPEYHNLRALLKVLKKKPEAARQSYEQALSIDPNNVLSLLGLAQLQIEAGAFGRAKEYANKALKIDNKNINTYRLLAGIAVQQKQYEEYEAVLLAALDKVKGNIALEKAVIDDLVKLYAFQKKPEKGLSLSEDLAKRYPDNSQALSALAVAQIAADKKDAAEKTLRQLIGMEKQDVASRLVLAQLLMGQPGKEHAVFNLLDEAMAADPKNTQAITVKTAYLTKLQRYPEALELAAKAEKLFPALPLGNALKGSVYLAEKKFDQALEAFLQVYKSQPNDQLLFVIADLMKAQDQQAEALAFLETALKKAPDNNAIHFKLAENYIKANNMAKAEKHYQAILAAQPENVLVLNNLAWLYAQQNNPKALELARKAFDKAPESAAIVDTYGYVLVKQGKLAEGLAMLEKAAGLAPKANDIQLHLAEAYAANGNKRKAIEILERITKAEQDFPEKKAAVELLAKLKAN